MNQVDGWRVGTPLRGIIADQAKRSTNFHLFSLDKTPDTVKKAFSAVRKAEMDWPWLLAIAQSTLASNEEMIVAALTDVEGNCLSAIPLVRRGRLFRAATSCYT